MVGWFFSHGESNARGVAILISKDLPITISDIVKDSMGCFILLDCIVYDQRYVISNIYAPTIDKLGDQKCFGEYMVKQLECYAGSNIIIGGDFNICLDDIGDHVTRSVSYRNSLTQLLELLNIADIWRIRHPFTKQYTRREKTRFGIKQTRIDYILVSHHLGFTTKSVEILPSIKSDHSLLKLSLLLEGVAKQGRGWWKMNTSLLSDNEYISLVRSTIKHVKTDLINLSNKDIAWDYIKCRIRTESITYSIKKKKTVRRTFSKANRAVRLLGI